MFCDAAGFFLWSGARASKQKSGAPRKIAMERSPAGRRSLRVAAKGTLVPRSSPDSGRRGGHLELARCEHNEPPVMATLLLSGPAFERHAPRSAFPMPSPRKARAWSQRMRRRSLIHLSCLAHANRTAASHLVIRVPCFSVGPEARFQRRGSGR